MGANFHVHRNNAVFRAKLQTFQFQLAIDKDPNIRQLDVMEVSKPPGSEAPAGLGIAGSTPETTTLSMPFLIEAVPWLSKKFQRLTCFQLSAQLPEPLTRVQPSAAASAVVSTVHVYWRHSCGTLVSLGVHRQIVSYEPSPPTLANI